jgi:histidinol-phosphate aminotransferase
MKAFIRRNVREMAGYTPGEQLHVPGLIKLNTNEAPYPPSPKVGEALRRFDPADLRRYPDPVAMGLRRRLARIHACRPEQVFAGNGSDEVLTLCLRAFVEEGGAIGCFEPSYSLYKVLAEAAGVAYRPVQLGPRFEWRTPPRGGASIFFLTCPNAPTGIAYPRETVEAFCRSFRGLVVIDEAYADFADRTCMDLAGRLKNVLVLRTLSKSFALAGIRLGYLVGDERLIGALFKIKDSYNVNALTQVAAEAALSDLAYMRKLVRRIRVTRKRLAAALDRLGFDVYPSQTNFLWVKPAAVSGECLYRALKDRNILVRHFPGARTGEFVRITVGTDAETDALLEAVAAIVRAAR